MAKKTIASEVASAFGAAAARVENLKGKRSATAKHAKAKVAKAAQATPGVVADAVRVPARTGEQPALPAALPEMQTQQFVPAVEEEVVIDRDQVAEIAYLYWENRGYQGGSPHEDWVRAEEEYKQRQRAKATGV